MSCKNEFTRQRAASCGCNNAETAAEPVSVPGTVQDTESENSECKRRRSEEFSEPVCVSVDKVYDACRERTCVVDERVYFTECGQEIIESAINVKLKKAEIIWVYTDTEPVLYSSGYYSVDIKYFIDVTIEAFSDVCAPTEVHGLVTYDKRVMLYGSEGQTKSFESTIDPGDCMEHIWKSNNMPKITVEVVNPIALSARLVDDSCCCCDTNVSIPTNICSCYGEDLVIANNIKKVLVSLGLFTIFRIERKVQLLIDAVDFCIPEKTCVGATPQDPCDLFDNVRFPIDEFFPPTKTNDFTSSNCGKNDRGCGCGCRCGN